ncbi:hypothetical protein F5Y15DRAFT_411119 [Xylariaceae sp. FL0016]|nr:hypothetical protein F5Y15DRAFT_411119 [Xylariaceae sp. FL0016]
MLPPQSPREYMHQGESVKKENVPVAQTGSGNHPPRQDMKGQSQDQEITAQMIPESTKIWDEHSHSESNEEPVMELSKRSRWASQQVPSPEIAGQNVVTVVQSAALSHDQGRGLDEPAVQTTIPGEEELDAVIQTRAGNKHGPLGGSPHEILAFNYAQTQHETPVTQLLTSQAIANAFGVYDFRPIKNSLSAISNGTRNSVTLGNGNLEFDYDDSQMQSPQHICDCRWTLPEANAWTDQDWNATPRTRRDAEKKKREKCTSFDIQPDLMTPWLQRFVNEWRQNVPYVEASFLSEDSYHERCDIDTMTGRLLDPVHFPEPREADPNKPAIVSEPVSTTIKRKNKQAADLKRIRESKAQSNGKLGETVDTASPQPQSDADPEYGRSGRVHMAAYFRPAALRDLEDIEAIYNGEIKGYKMADAEPLDFEHFQDMYNECLQNNMPFIVAVEGWHDPEREDTERVIGFTFIDFLYRGIRGSPATFMPEAGKVTLVVHENFRQQGLGTMLLDLAVSSCSRAYNTKSGYQFVNPNGDRRLYHPDFNPRQWCYLVIDVVVKSGKNKDEVRRSAEFQWIYDWLEAKFVFLLENHIHKAFYNPRDRDRSEWYDRFTFRHQCNPVKVKDP